jgi:hypothetical protein
VGVTLLTIQLLGFRDLHTTKTRRKRLKTNPSGGRIQPLRGDFSLRGRGA